VVEHIKHGLHRCCADKREDGWISVATSLPKFDEFVDLWVTHAEGGGKRLADHSRVYVTNEGWYWCDEEGTAIEEFGYEPEDITHWRNRPAPPEASK